MVCLRYSLEITVWFLWLCQKKVDPTREILCFSNPAQPQFLIFDFQLLTKKNTIRLRMTDIVTPDLNPGTV